jgi:hypothetical protein
LTDANEERHPLLGARDLRAPLQHGRTYIVATPVFEPGAAEALLRELESALPH